MVDSTQAQAEAAAEWTLSRLLTKDYEALIRSSVYKCALKTSIKLLYQQTLNIREFGRHTSGLSCHNRYGANSSHVCCAHKSPPPIISPKCLTFVTKTLLQIEPCTKGPVLDSIWPVFQLARHFLYVAPPPPCFKGILHQKIFYRLNLIFWIVMGCGIARFGRRGLKTTET